MRGHSPLPPRLLRGTYSLLIMARGIGITVERVVRAGGERTFDSVAPVPLEEIFNRFGPIPGVKGTRDQTGDWDEVGQTRVVELTDGSQAQEELTTYDRPRHFAYRLSELTGPLRLLVDHADGAWWFADRGDGTTGVTWTYCFEPRFGGRWVTRCVIAPFWRRYAGRALDRAVRIAERRKQPA
jgi:hypothetical protein